MYHLALSHTIELDHIQAQAAAGKRPRHVMWGLSQRLNATIHTPGTEPILRIDRLRSKLMGQPQNWALARRLAAELTSDDVIYCTDEDVGIPIATLCGMQPSPPKVAVFIHTGHRPRSRVALKLFRSAERVSLFVSNCRPQIEFLHDYLKLPDEQVFSLLEQTDTQFFTPGSALSYKPRPVIASVGLEKRDYRSLAAATADLDVDVKISGFSADVRPLARSFPKTLPDNMSRRFYEWTELVQLYRDADLVVVSLFPSQDTAGVTTLLEAMACHRPVIVTQTEGLADYLEMPGSL
ncbi:glycosyltransferase, partial [Leptolyngbya sp. FACHB-36]|nr:glycosyltransferase [Leptolyngbya sp. FACHB-36]